ncbi:hypothetical protein EVAR_95481_1 [Eumeta japonica]|uniref:Uncharacterized protein n=1 Tax=Eumeta variegata TaxID=151549 RepID=A0A4C1UJG5_EUMVA|nr:hypothetical protein EVAR_95481_1 [Eumeta japonica]
MAQKCMSLDVVNVSGTITIQGTSSPNKDTMRFFNLVRSSKRNTEYDFRFYSKLLSWEREVSLKDRCRNSVFRHQCGLKDVVTKVEKNYSVYLSRQSAFKERLLDLQVHTVAKLKSVLGLGPRNRRLATRLRFASSLCVILLAANELQLIAQFITLHATRTINRKQKATRQTQPQAPTVQATLRTVAHLFPAVSTGAASNTIMLVNRCHATRQRVVISRRLNPPTLDPCGTGADDEPRHRYEYDVYGLKTFMCSPRGGRGVE